MSKFSKFLWKKFLHRFFQTVRDVPVKMTSVIMAIKIFEVPLTLQGQTGSTDILKAQFDYTSLR